MKTIILDNSVLCRLFDEKTHRHALLIGLRQIGSIQITTLNVLETAERSDTNERNNKLEFYSEVAGDVMPLDPPEEILRKTALAFVQGAATIQLGNSTAWKILKEPTLVTQALRDESYEWSTQRSNAFRGRFENIRPVYQNHFQTMSSDRMKSATEFIRYLCKGLDRYAAGFLQPMFQDITGHAISQEQVIDFIRGSNEWQLFLAAQAHALYTRSIQENNFGNKKKANVVDLQSAVYLSFCDLFITADNDQFKVLAEVNRLNLKECQVKHWKDYSSAFSIR